MRLYIAYSAAYWLGETKKKPWAQGTEFLLSAQVIQAKTMGSRLVAEEDERSVIAITASSRKVTRQRTASEKEAFAAETQSTWTTLESCGEELSSTAFDAPEVAAEEKGRKTTAHQSPSTRGGRRRRCLKPPEREIRRSSTMVAGLLKLPSREENERQRALVSTE
nr:hypothetical protein Iba_chr09eCG7630 [Ipomoea batatas]